MQTDFYHSSLFILLKAEADEINRLKWLESEKAKRDIGRNLAIHLWVKLHRTPWMAKQKKGSN
jgi:hypothetical protein